MAKKKISTGYSENKLPYIKIGKGPKKLVVFEGLNFSHKIPSGMQVRMHRRMFKGLPSDYTVYIVGRKPGLPEGCTMRDMSNDYAVMVRDENGAPVDIAGISTGGPPALWFAVDHRDLMEKLVLISTGYRLSDYGKKVQQEMLEAARKGKKRKTAAATAGLLVSKGFKSRMTKIVFWLFGPAIFGKADSLSDGIVELEAEDIFDFEERLPTVKVPTLVVGGTGDPLYPIKETAEKIPDAKLVLYESTGHIAPSGKKFVDDLVEFLEY